MSQTLHVPGVCVRIATVADAAPIARIYNQGIEDRVATFETSRRSTNDIEMLLFARRDAHACFVAEREGHIVAVAWTSEYRSRACYAGIAEFSVYVDRAYRGKGLGSDVMGALLEDASRRGFWKLVSRVFPENQPSLALLKRLGFRQVGMYYRHGKLDGRWKDVVIVEKLIGEAELPEN